MGNSQQPPSVPYAAFDLAGFTSGLAHELANPLNALAMNAEVARLLIERNDSERARERLAALVADCTRCGRLLQSIRRFGAGMTPGVAEPATVADLVAAACDQLRREGPVPAVEVHGGETELIVDRSAMSRALAELLRNAIEAGARNVRIVAGRDGGGCFADFVDDGAGIPASLRHRVMEPFFSTRRNEGNAGLGLTLAHEVLRANGGSLSIGAGVERGTCVRITVAGENAVRAGISPAETATAT